MEFLSDVAYLRIAPAGKGPTTCKDTVSLVFQSVRFYSHVICPVSPDCPCRSPSAGRRGFSSFRFRISSRRRSCGKVEIPLLLRDFQWPVGTVENRFLVFHGFHGTGFSTAPLPL